MTVIVADTVEDAALTEAGAAEEFLKRFAAPDAEKLPGSEGTEDDKTATEETEETSAEEPEATEETTETEKDADDKTPRKFADDTVYVKVKVGEETHEVAVKDLQRLFGQEKSLTQKSMEVAETRKTVDAELAKNTAASAALLERAKQRWEPYSKIDFLLAAKELTADDYTALRKEAQAAYEDVQFLDQHLTGFMQTVKAQQQNELRTQAVESLKVLTGPVDKGGIEGWNEKLYDETRAFAISAGLDKGLVNSIVDASAIRLMHDAMLYRRGASKVITTKVNKTPTKVIKTTTSPAVTRTGGDKTKVDVAMRNLARTGSTDDAANAFMANWAKNSDD